MEPIPLPDTLAELIRKHCSSEWQALIKEKCTTLSFEGGEDIFKEGHPADQLYIVRKGKAKVYSTFEPGSARILRFARDGQALGHRGIGEDFSYTVTATALVPTTVDLIPMPLFLSTLKANAAFSFHFMLFFAEELRRSEAQTKALMNISVEQRVAKALLATARCFGYDKDDRTLLAYTPSRQDLADYAGTTYESTIRALSALQKKKLIKTVGRDIRIADRKGLEKVLTKA
ncbi:MAG: Crp/Fnr family transcriptional regulator [Flavobacteriales bacterium]